MDRNIARIELLNRAAILTPKEISFTKAYCDTGSIKKSVEAAGIAASNTSVLKRKIEAALTGQLKNNGKRKSINNRTKYTDTQWEDRQKSICYIVDVILNKEGLADTIVMNKFVFDYLAPGTKVELESNNQNDSITDVEAQEESKVTHVNFNESDYTDSEDESDTINSGGYTDSTLEDAFETKKTKASISRQDMMAGLLPKKQQTDKIDKESITVDSVTNHQVNSQAENARIRGLASYTVRPNSVNSSDIIAVYASYCHPLTNKDVYIVNELLRLFNNVIFLVLKKRDSNWEYLAAKKAFESEARVKVESWDKPEEYYQQYSNSLIHIKPVDSSTNMVELLRDLELKQIVNQGYREIYISLPASIACITSEKLVDMCKRGGDITNFIPADIARHSIQQILGG